MRRSVSDVDYKKRLFCIVVRRVWQWRTRDAQFKKALSRFALLLGIPSRHVLRSLSVAEAHILTLSNKFHNAKNDISMSFLDDYQGRNNLMVRYVYRHERRK